MLTKKITFDKDIQKKLFDFFLNENNLINNVLNEREIAILTMRLQYKHPYRIIGTSLGLSYQRVIVLYNKTLLKLNNIYTTFTKNNYAMGNNNSTNSILIQSINSLSNKSKSELLKNDINTLQELQKYKVKDLMMFTRIGKKTIDEIKAVFLEHNLKFSDT